ncbi:hypothetical protein MCOR07_001443 [Pyricularia oryzae]|uniref:RNA-dependent RNA polymerase n=1 Tax=Pyricularia grisea TaxID=148305 RepID=A0ABQ8NSF1_PYRGI|nr:hypothetical protein MCOR01_002295 [Pyricularia oryzae]KAI6301410.1 hypothetical protein MCOR33_003085 [Pyricularia grisea]KAI6286141.1 hypothetical protein MCOR26_001218 [Pyricularia oryzae]KAI6336794.1 hypothetical protein MCOR29_000170 [Pyricularia oryzae]KAI6341537.1 hypothetical protein MCOR30_002112 [Pyricularia oryzae]
MPLPLRLRHIPIPCSASKHTPLQMACWLQSRIQQDMVDNKLETRLTLPIPKQKHAAAQRRDWVKTLLMLNIPNSSCPSHLQELLKHIGPPPTVISFMPQPAFDIPGLAVDPESVQKARQLAAPLPKLIHSHEIAFGVRSLGMELPDSFTWDQLQEVVEQLLKNRDKWSQAGISIPDLSIPHGKPNQKAAFLQVDHFIKRMEGFVSEVKDDTLPSVPLVTDLAAKHGLQPIDTNPAFFGPGTLMLWPVMDLSDSLQLPQGASLTSERALHDILAQATIRTIKEHFRLDGYIKPGETGVWVDDKTSPVPRRVATVRPIVGPKLITSFGVGLQVGPLHKVANNVDQTMTSLAELGGIPNTPASLANHWAEVFADLLNATPKRSAGFKFKVQKSALKLKAMENPLAKGPAWTVDHLEDSALGWRTQSHVDTSLKRSLFFDDKVCRLTANWPLHKMGDLFDSASARITDIERGDHGRYGKKALPQINGVMKTMGAVSELAQGRPWLGVDKIMDAWHTRPINMTTISKLDLHMLDHRPVILGNESFPKLEPIPPTELISDLDLTWPDLAVPEVESIDQQPTYALDLEDSWKRYCGWVLRLLRESSLGRQLDTRLLDHSARFVTAEMMTNSGVALAVIKGANSSIARSIHHGLNYMQCAAVYRRALTASGQPRGDAATLSRQEARLILPHRRRISRRWEKHVEPVKRIGAAYRGGLLPPEDFGQALTRLVRHPGQNQFSRRASKIIEARYGKQILRATGLKKAPPTWRADEDFLGRY